LAFFLVGAYQEILGMKHNLFTHPTEVTVEFTEDGYSLEKIVEAQSILDILYDMDYDLNELQSNLKTNLANSNFLDVDEKEKIFELLALILNENSYLKMSPKKDNE